MGEKLNDIGGGCIKLNGQIKNIAEIKYGNRIVWPLYTFRFSDIQVLWSAGTYFFADGSNNVMVTATVEKYLGERLVETVPNSTLTPVVTGNTFYALNGRVYAYDLGTTPKAQTSEEVVFKYGDGEVARYTFTQEANKIENTDTSRVINVALSSNNVPAKDASVSAGITFSTTNVYTWTSGATSRDASTGGNANVYRIFDGVETLVASNVENGEVVQIAFADNETAESRTYTIKANFIGHEVTASAEVVQYGGDKTYGAIVWTSYGATTIAASGGTAEPYAYWEQSWGWNGATTGGGTITGGASSFAVVAGTDTGANLGTTPKEQTKIGVVRASVTSYGKSGSIDIDIIQVENKVETHRDAVDTTTGWSFALNDSSVPCTDASVTLINCTRVYTYTTAYDKYTSGAETGGVTTTGNTASAMPTALSCEGATVDLAALKVSVGKNAHNESERTFIVVASYGGYEDSHAFTQSADSYTTTHAVIAGSYAVDDITTEGAVNAGGGAEQLAAIAYHYNNTVYHWASGADDTYGSNVYVPDSVNWSIVAISASNVFGITDAGYLTHRDMKANVTTDTCTVRAANASATGIYKSKSYAVVNKVETHTDAKDETTAFSFELTEATLPAYASSTTLKDYVRSWKKTTAYNKYTSGAEEGGAVSTGTESMRPTALSCEGATATLSTLNIAVDANTRNESVRTFTVYASYDGKSAQRTLTQSADTYTEQVTIKPNSYVASEITLETGSISASGGSLTYGASAWHYTNVIRTWASGAKDTEGDVQALDDVVWSFSARSTAAAFSLEASGGSCVVSHRNMGTDATTDSFTLRAANASATNVYSETSGSTSNARHTGDATTTRSVTTSHWGDVSANGGSVSLDYISETSTPWWYDSGSSGSDVQPITSTISASLGSLSKTSVNGRGSVTLTLPYNTGAARASNVYINGAYQLGISQAAGASTRIEWYIENYAADLTLSTTSGVFTSNGEHRVIDIYNVGYMGTSWTLYYDGGEVATGWVDAGAVVQYDLTYSDVQAAAINGVARLYFTD